MRGQTITGVELQELVEHTHPTAVSLVIPTDRTNPDPRTNSLVFKNQVNTCLDWLKELEADNDTYQTLDDACEQLLNDELFWKDQAGSFVLLAGGDEVQTYQLDTHHDELIMINDHHYILPFISQISQQATFYVLELDKDQTQMWQGTSTSLEKVDVPDLPVSVAEVTGTETGERHLQFHTGTDAPKGDVRAAQFHGSSSWKDDHDRYLERFLHAVDAAVVNFLKQQPPTPLLVSGVEELSVMFHKLSKYDHLVEGSLPKVADPTHKQQELHQHAESVITDLKNEYRQHVLAQFEETVPTRKVTVLPEVLRQAAQGKIDTLLVAENTRVWGMFDPETMTPLIERDQQPRSAELLNVAARLTLMSSGAVSMVPAEEMPADAQVAAILRY